MPIAIGRLSDTELSVEVCLKALDAFAARTTSPSTDATSAQQIGEVLPHGSGFGHDRVTVLSGRRSYIGRQWQPLG